MDELELLLKEYKENFRTAPLYGGYSRTLQRKIPSKGQVRKEFLENIQELLKLTVDPVVETAIEKLLAKFE